MAHRERDRARENESPMISKRSNTASAKGRDALCVPVQKVKDMEEVSDNWRSVPDGLLPAVEPVPVSPLRAAIPSATVAEEAGDVVWFKIRAGWEWASIFVRPFGEGAEVVAHSSFGTFGYTWIAMGGCWRDFLPSLSREYAMRKLAGQSYDVPLDRDEFIAAMRAAVDDEEKNIIEAWGILDADQQRRITSCRDALDEEYGWEDVPLDALFWHFNENASGAPYAMELYEMRMTKINPQVVGFWETIWKPFADHLAQAIDARRAETHSGSVADESAVAKPCAQGDAT